MLKENLKSARKSKGLSQEELSIKLNVVRQTISKWEQGLSVPDAEMLISISEELDTPVSTLLGESISIDHPNDLKVISEKLEIINLQLSKRKESKRKFWHYTFIAICLITVIIIVGIAVMGDTYLEWDYNKIEYAIIGVIIHSIVWLFVRLSPIIFILSTVGACLTRKKE